VDARRLARLLSSGVRTVRTWDAAGKLPRPFKLGGRTLWDLPEVRAWLRAGASDRDRWEAIKAARRK
jgi:predicted DNA-binding transcriptional regulator AlpA